MPSQGSEIFDDRQPWPSYVLQRFRADPTRRRNVRCPAHEDRRPSLSVKLEDDRLLLRCHAGCTHRQVLEAVGLRETDLFHPETRRIDRVGRADPGVEATYRYCSPSGEFLGSKVRRRGKRFDWVDRWGHASMPEGVTLYGVERLAAAIAAGEDVWLVAGEKDAEALTRAGVTAVSLPNGDDSWDAAWAPRFAGAVVIVFADADPSGWRMAQCVAHDLDGVALAVELVQAAPGCNDAHDHLTAGHGLSAVQSIDPAQMLDEHVPTAELLDAVSRYPFPSVRSAPALRKVLSHLGRNADATGHVRAAYSSIAVANAMSGRTARRLLGQLVEIGLVAQVERGRMTSDGALSTLWRVECQELATFTPHPHSSFMYSKKVVSSCRAAAPAHDAHRAHALGARGDELRTALLAGPGTAAELARRLGVARGTAHHHLRKAVAAGTATYDPATKLYAAVAGDEVLDQAAEHYGTVGAGERQRAALRRAAAARKRRWRAWVHRKHHTPPVAAYEDLADAVDDDVTAEPTRAEKAEIERDLQHRRAMRSKLALVG